MAENSGLSAAWVDGAEVIADFFGDVDTSDCPYGDPELVTAWREGAGATRDWDGRADLSSNPYEH